MGTALARLLIAHGYPVRLGSRTSDRGRADQAVTLPLVPYAKAAEAAVIVLATTWQDTPGALQAVGPLPGRILIDCTNPESSTGFGLEIGHSMSGAEMVAQWSGGARVVKAFNHIYAEVLSEPGLRAQGVTVFLCGDDDSAKREVATLVANCGLDPVDAGALTVARYTEPVAQLMVQLVRVQQLDPSSISLRLIRNSGPEVARR
jgi:predicted dinucleotide-binding enzyme